jgi:hypothetical protein
MARPVLRRMALVPLKSLQVREELGDGGHPLRILSPYTDAPCLDGRPAPAAEARSLSPATEGDMTSVSLRIAAAALVLLTGCATVPRASDRLAQESRTFVPPPSATQRGSPR